MSDITVVENDFITKHAGGRPAKFTSVEDMEAAIAEYWAYCEQMKRPKTMSGLAIALGFKDRLSLRDYKERDKFSHTIQRAKFIVELELEERMISSNGVVAGIIFNAKNNFGYVDKTEVDNRHEMVTPILGGSAKQIEAAEDN